MYEHTRIKRNTFILQKHIIFNISVKCLVWMDFLTYGFYTCLSLQYRKILWEKRQK